MKTNALLFLLAACQLCFASGDTNLIAMSDWSQPVRSSDSAELRARMIVTYGRSPGFSGPGPETLFYLDFENLGGSPFPTDFYFDPEHGLHCEVRDANGKLLPIGGGGSGPGGNPAAWISLPRDSTIRLNAGDYGYGQKPGQGLTLAIWRPTRSWYILSGDTNTYFLSGTFTLTAPTNFVSKLRGREETLFTGTFQLPAVKIYPVR